MRLSGPARMQVGARTRLGAADQHIVEAVSIDITGQKKEAPRPDPRD